jgi:hypothetical protein
VQFLHDKQAHEETNPHLYAQKRLLLLGQVPVRVSKVVDAVNGQRPRLWW